MFSTCRGGGSVQHRRVASLLLSSTWWGRRRERKMLSSSWHEKEEVRAAWRRGRGGGNESVAACRPSVSFSSSLFFLLSFPWGFPGCLISPSLPSSFSTEGQSSSNGRGDDGGLPLSPFLPRRRNFSLPYPRLCTCTFSSTLFHSPSSLSSSLALPSPFCVPSHAGRWGGRRRGMTAFCGSPCRFFFTTPCRRSGAGDGHSHSGDTHGATSRRLNPPPRTVSSSQTHFDVQDVDGSRLTHEFWQAEGEEGGEASSPKRPGEANSPYIYSSSPSSPSSTTDDKEGSVGKKELSGVWAHGANDRSATAFPSPSTTTSTPHSADAPVSYRDKSAVLTEKEEPPLSGGGSSGSIADRFEEECPPGWLEEFLSPGEFMGIESLLFIADADKEFLKDEFA